MGIPGKAEWQALNHANLDEAWAYKDFYGKTFDEAVRLFEENAIHYQEDLTYMPGPVFGFYLRAYIAYLISDAAQGDPDGASCFVHLILFQAEHDRSLLVPLWSEIELALKHIVEHQNDYGADRSIYGNFRTKARRLARYGFVISFDAEA